MPRFQISKEINEACLFLHHRFQGRRQGVLIFERNSHRETLFSRLDIHTGNELGGGDVSKVHLSFGHV